MTSLVSAGVRSVTTLSWEWSWVLWTSTALVSYVMLLRTADRWVPWVRAVVPPAPQAIERQVRREALIRDWRTMTNEIHAKTLAMRDGRVEYVFTEELLSAHPAFLSLRPHLSEHARKVIWPHSDKNEELRRFTASHTGPMDHELEIVAIEVDRLEREWGLR